MSSVDRKCDRLKQMELALARLEDLTAELAARVDVELDEHRAEVAPIRRGISEQQTKIFFLSDEVFEGPVLETFRMFYLRMRIATENHQSSWPAVSIDVQCDEYQASSRRLREANREFLEWSRAALSHFGSRA